MKLRRYPPPPPPSPSCILPVPSPLDMTFYIAEEVRNIKSDIKSVYPTSVPNYSWSQIFHSQIFLFSDFHSQIFSFSDFSFSDFFILRFSFSDFFILGFSFLVFCISDFRNYTKLTKNKNRRIKISEINYSLVTSVNRIIVLLNTQLDI